MHDPELAIITIWQCIVEIPGEPDRWFWATRERDAQQLAALHFPNRAQFGIPTYLMRSDEARIKECFKYTITAIPDALAIWCNAMFPRSPEAPSYDETPISGRGELLRDSASHGESCATLVIYA